MKPRLCIDIDNTIADSDPMMRRVIVAVTSGRVNLIQADVKEFAYQKCKDSKGNCITEDEWKTVHDRFSETSNLMQIDPFPGVQAHLAALSSKFVLHIVTSRLHRARAATVEWLEKYDFPPHWLHFVGHGEKHSALGKFDGAVEDHYEQAASFAGIDTPSFLIRKPWNSGKSPLHNLAWVENWSQLVAVLLG